MTQTFPQLMRWFLVAMAVAATSTAGEGYCEPTLPTIDFHRDVRPLLADKCFRCHGPDEKARQGQLRLDQRESAIAMREGTAAIVPGRPDQSELMKRIEASDGDRSATPSGLRVAGVPGCTTSPESSSQLPRGRTRIVRGVTAVVTRVIGYDLTKASRCFSSSAI